MSTGANHLRTTVLTLAFCWAVASPAYEFAGGTGEPNDPYQIATAEQLISIGSDPNLLDKHFVLLNDLDLDPNLPGGQVFTRAVIAPDMDPAEDFQGMPFTGSFDGNGHIVRSLIIRNDADYLDDDDYLGLFGNLGRQAVVQNLRIEAAEVGERYGEYHGVLAGWNEGRIVRCHVEGGVDGGARIGGLVGQNRGEIFSCHADGDFVSGHMGVGGLVGENSAGAQVVGCDASCGVWVQRDTAGGLVGLNQGYVTSSHATGDVLAVGYGVSALGGLVGYSGASGMITSCHAAGDISTWEWGLDSGFAHAGGLVGRASSTGIVNCYASGSISGSNKSWSVGGLVGSTLYGWIMNSYAIGRVSAGGNSKYLGGLIGEQTDTTIIKASFWDIETSGLSQSAGGTGLTTAQMQDVNTYITAKWDFAGERENGTADVWLMPQGGGYPTLTLGSDDAHEPPELAGRGTADDPYRIGTPEDLGAVWRHDPSACYKLTADIDLCGITWGAAPIGCFNGKLDGAGRTVSNLKIQGDYCLGLFGILDQNASVVNLGIHAANITGMGTLGMLAGRNTGRIVGCYANGAVSGIDRAGGLIGWNGGSISDSYAIGEVTAIASTGVGGLTGWNAGSISRCYAAAYVTSTMSVQGYVNVTGGLVGDNRDDSLLYPPGQVYDSYFLIDADGGGPDNGLGVPLTDAQMRQQASFVDWDFEGVWMICEGRDYPRLRWQNVQCEE